ncbi:IS5 family transposase [Mesorhizobium sp. M0684]|uniref:IS5 family transposase n=1 Tax=Mesorhizobium sp. M0684 TaxID=2956986 RepID=UPI00333A3681
MKTCNKLGVSFWDYLGNRLGIPGSKILPHPFSSPLAKPQQQIDAPKRGRFCPGYAGKKIVGRKRHIAVDTDGRLLMVNLTPADISDSAGAQAILDGIRQRWPWVKHLFADGAYDRLKLMDKAAYLDFVVEIIRRSDDQKGFEVLPRRWVVERTFGWMTRWRRLVRDYEQRIDVSHAMILVAMGANLIRRNAHP